MSVQGHMAPNGDKPAQAQPQAQPIDLGEAPYSVNFRAASPEGYEMQFTIRSITETGLIQRLGSLLHALEGNEYTPAARGAAARQTNAEDRVSPRETSDPSWCSIHQAQMKARTANGETWYSHKDPEGGWCRGGKKKA